MYMRQNKIRRKGTILTPRSFTKDETGKVPQRHIPARFISLIPREFPNSKPPRSKRTNTGARKESVQKVPPTGINPSKVALSKPQLTPQNSDRSFDIDMLDKVPFGGGSFEDLGDFDFIDFGNRNVPRTASTAAEVARRMSGYKEQS